MNDHSVQLALHDWRWHLVDPVTLCALVGVAAVLLMSGPFGTADVMRLIPAFGYWLVLVAGSYAVGVFLGEVFLRGQQATRRWTALSLAFLATGAAAAILVMVLMRLGDAIREIGGTVGARVRHSHLVEWSAVRAARRSSDCLRLRLASGREVPVSRANVAAVKEAGRLPK